MSGGMGVSTHVPRIEQALHGLLSEGRTLGVSSQRATVLAFQEDAAGERIGSAQAGTTLPDALYNLLRASNHTLEYPDLTSSRWLERFLDESWSARRFRIREEDGLVVAGITCDHSGSLCVAGTGWNPIAYAANMFAGLGEANTYFRRIGQWAWPNRRLRIQL